LYRKTRVITDPIKKLVMNVNRISDGHLNERAEVSGNNEITRLSEKFNLMIAQLEEYYNKDFLKIFCNNYLLWVQMLSIDHILNYR